MTIRLVFAYFGCVFLAADLLHIPDMGAALPFIAIIALGSVSFAIRDMVGARDDTRLASRWIRIALVALAACTIPGGIASTIPSLRIIDEGHIGEPQAISTVAGPIVWAALFVLAIRALVWPSPRRLAHVGIASTLAWPMLHFAAFLAQFAFLSTLEILEPHAIVAYGIAVYGVALIGVTIGIVGASSRESRIDLAPAIAMSRAVPNAATLSACDRSCSSRSPA